MLLGCVDKDTKQPSLFSIDPSGMVFKYSATASGKGKQAAKTELEKLVGSDMTCEQAIVSMAKVLHKVHDEKDKDFELEMSWICPNSNYEHAAVPKDLLAKVQDEAKKAIEAEEDED